MIVELIFCFNLIIFGGYTVIDGKTNILGVIGDPIEHTFSPAMHNAGLKDLGLNYVYLPFLVKSNNLNSAVEGAKGLDIKGLNVTIPHKQNIISCLDEIDSIASMIGAVNTVKFFLDDENIIRTKGYNTDAYGAVKAIEEVTDLKDKKVTIVGAGGASRAVSFQIASSGIDELSILNRNHKKAENLADDLKINLNKLDVDVNIASYEIDDLATQISESDILIDTTPLGMYPNINDKPIADSSMIHENLVVNDIVYTPMKTSLIKEALKANAKVVYGYKMLLYQGIRSFEIWLDTKAPVKAMEDALLDVLGI